MDTVRLRASWALVTAHGAQVRKFFYARLFLGLPELRAIFPVSMAPQSDRLIITLGRIVSNVDKLPLAMPAIEQLGRHHRRLAVRAEYYGHVRQALLATLARFLGRDWTPELARDWTEAYTRVATVMTEAAAAAERIGPPWWEAEVVGHERRRPDIAVLRLRPEPAYPYRAGQSMQVEVPARPFAWRPYSPANAPRADGTVDLHVRAVPGGLVSTALVETVTPGDVLRLGEPVGSRLTMAGDTGRDLVLLAGGTGLAPLKALVEELAGTRVHRRRVTLYAAARTAPELYDLPALERLERTLPWLTVVPVTSNASNASNVGNASNASNVCDVALSRPGWADSDVYVCGPEVMVSQAVTRFAAAGVPLGRIHAEDFDPDPYHAITRAYALSPAC